MNEKEYILSKLDTDLYILVRNAIIYHNAEIVEDYRWLVLDDKVAKITYVISNRNDFPISAYSNLEPTMCVISLLDFEFDYKPYFNNYRKTVQYSYHGEVKEISKDIEIEKVTMDDLDYIMSHYYRTGDDKEYLTDAINRGMLKAVKNGRIAGFIGEHPEMSLGLLYVDDDFRRQGIGRQLEQAMINEVLNKGRIPIDHVVLENDISKKLQSSFEGMELNKGFIYWLF